MRYYGMQAVYTPVKTQLPVIRCNAKNTADSKKGKSIKRKGKNEQDKRVSEKKRHRNIS